VTTYSYAQLEALWIQAGGSSSVAPVAAAIALAESGGNPLAAYPGTTVAAGQGSTSDATGLWQILGLPSGNFSASGLTNPLSNAKMAVAKYDQAGDSFSPWQTYTSGAYEQYLQSGVAPAGGAPSTSSSPTSSTPTPTATIAAGTSGNVLVDAIEFISNFAADKTVGGNLEGIVKFISEGLQAFGQVNHLAAVLIDYPLSMFKPGQAWRMVFWVLTAVAALLAYRAFAGHMPHAPDLI
jgi:hypothetical protein